MDRSRCRPVFASGHQAPETAYTKEYKTKEGTKGGKNERKALNLHNPRTCTDYTGITKKGDGREELRGEKCWRWQKRSGTADAR
jgi:hypothetical protein